MCYYILFPMKKIVTCDDVNRLPIVDDSCEMPCLIFSEIGGKIL